MPRRLKVQNRPFTVSYSTPFAPVYRHFCLEPGGSTPFAPLYGWCMGSFGLSIVGSTYYAPVYRWVVLVGALLAVFLLHPFMGNFGLRVYGNIHE